MQLQRGPLLNQAQTQTAWPPPTHSESKAADAAKIQPLREERLDGVSVPTDRPSRHPQDPNGKQLKPISIALEYQRRPEKMLTTIPHLRTGKTWHGSDQTVLFQISSAHESAQLPKRFISSAIATKRAAAFASASKSLTIYKAQGLAANILRKIYAISNHS